MILPCCNESICYECLCKLKTQDGKVVCPNDKETSEFDKVKVYNSLMRKLKSTSWLAIKCDEHPENEANVYC
jgi:hypothetical protein